MGELTIQTVDERFVTGPLWRIGPPGPCSRSLAFTQLRFGLH